MKARIPNSLKNADKKVLFGKGKEYSAIANEAEQNLINWLNSSELSEEKFLEMVDRDDLHLTFWTDNKTAITMLHHSGGEIAQPLIWQKETGILLKNYRIDAALMLFLVSEKAGNPRSKEKIRTFIKTELCPIL